ncbi:hypothetical protein CPB86DRAFT_46035 [Serendipita vermifera]|nr:hypothetical protein CPB86DRAFT_46035 [Serendipita vermifera]
MRGLTGGEGDASEWTRRQERRQYWSFIEYKQTAPISTLLSRADRRDLGLSTLSGKKLVYSEDCIRRNGVLCRSNKGWFKTSREDMLEIHKPVISTHSLCWLGDTANRSGFCGLYDLDGLLSPIFTFTVEWESDDKKEYILKPVAEDNANYDTIGFCYYHSEEELSYEKMSKLIDQKPWNRLRGVRRDLLERVEWRPDPVRVFHYQRVLTMLTMDVFTDNSLHTSRRRTFSTVSPNGT